MTKKSKEKWNQFWPVLKKYDQGHLRRIALPVGGIGTGTVSLGGRGDLKDWEVMNRPAKGFNPNAFFAIWTKDKKGRTTTRTVEGIIDSADYEGVSGCPVPNHNLPKFRKCSFATAYPLGQVYLSDADVPVDVRIETFNPLIPGDEESSGIPVAVIRYVLINKTGEEVSASICGTVVNFIGNDGSENKTKDNRNKFVKGKKLAGILMCSEGVDKQAEQWGTLALTTSEKAGITYRTSWADSGWGNALLDFWDDFSSDGKVEEREQGKIQDPKATLSVSVKMPARKEKTITFIISWHFPNRMTWTPVKEDVKEDESCGCGDSCCGEKQDKNIVGNYYATKYSDAWDVAIKTAESMEKLESETVKFVKAFIENDLPEPVKEAALFNLSTLRTQTAFRIKDGHFAGWEGCGDKGGCCHGSCTHVWNYEQTTAFTFGKLARLMREVEFKHSTGGNGLMSFRAKLPLEFATEWKAAAADGQMGCVMKLYRDWKLSGDDVMLKELWTNAKKVLEFCWIKGGWDEDKDGVMEGCQHNTMDIEYYGPNPEIGVWYLGALRAGEEMAKYIGDMEFSKTCGELFRKGSAWLDENLFNGEYYEQKITPAKAESEIAEGLRMGMGSKDLKKPDFQIGGGCLADQLVGQYVAHVCGLGYLLKKENVRKTMRSIMKYNFRENIFGHFNHNRSYAMNDEPALLVATYPLGRRPKYPFPYCYEAWTGLEYTASAGMIYEGMLKEGLKCVKSARSRHDGRKRNPFNEPECGHHYARAMSSWANLLAVTGFQYDGIEKSMGFNLFPSRKQTKIFWSNGYCWGLCRQKNVKGGVEVNIEVLHGELKLKKINIRGVGRAEWSGTKDIKAGKSLNVKIYKNK